MGCKYAPTHTGSPGGQLDTQTIQGLLTKLLAFNNNKRSNTTIENPTDDDLKDKLKEAALELFKANFGFSHGEANPEDKDPAYTGSADVLTVIDTGNLKQTQSCFHKLLPAQNVPDWAIEPSLNSIFSAAKSVFTESSPSEWKHKFLEESYNDPSNGNNAHKMKAVYLFTSIDFGGKSPPSHIVYYLGSAWGGKA